MEISGLINLCILEYLHFNIFILIHVSFISHQFYQKYPLLKCISFERQTLCLVAENHSTRHSDEFIILEQIVLLTFTDCNIEICCNDIQDISLVLQRLVKKDTLEVKETTDQPKFESKEDENNNEKDQPSSDDFVEEDNIE